MADSLCFYSPQSETFGDQIVPDTDDCFLAPADVSHSAYTANHVSVHLDLEVWSWLDDFLVCEITFYLNFYQIVVRGVQEISSRAFMCPHFKFRGQEITVAAWLTGSEHLLTASRPHRSQIQPSMSNSFYV